MSFLAIWILLTGGSMWGLCITHADYYKQIPVESLLIFGIFVPTVVSFIVWLFWNIAIGAW